MNGGNRKESSLKSNRANRFTAVLFAIYLATICYILLFKLGVRFSYGAERNVNLVPFYQSAVLTAENILNAVIFVPFGIYTAILFYRWHFGTRILLLFIMSLVVEGLQFVLGIGAFDATDIVANTLGGIVGVLLFAAMAAVVKDRVKAQTIINVVAALGTAVILVLLFLLKMNMLPVRYQ